MKPLFYLPCIDLLALWSLLICPACAFDTTDPVSAERIRVHALLPYSPLLLVRNPD